MAEVIWTEPALIEIAVLAEYIALDNPEAAERVVARIYKAGERLIQFPKAGARIPEFPRSAYRHLVVGLYRVIYRLEGNQAYIVFVLSGGRLLRHEYLT